MFDSLTVADCNSVLDQITSLVPKVLPAVIGFIGFRKAWQFLKHELLSA